MANSTAPTPAVKARNGRPEKPRPDFPLFAHASGRWAKKIHGRFAYFGQWSTDLKGERALELWLDQKDELLAGRKPRTSREGMTVAEMANRFLTFKQQLVDTGEHRPRTWQDYFTVCQRLTSVFGRNRLVVDLLPDDFAELRAAFAKTRGAYALAGDVTRTRVVFKWAFDQGLIPAIPRYGQSFQKPNAKALRIVRANNGPRMFERPQLWNILYGATIDGKRVEGASQPLRSMILLALNGGLGNGDVGRLPLSSINDRTGWLSFPRPKTGIARRVPLWPETIDCLREWLTVRPRGSDTATDALVFVTSRGGSWHKSQADNPISKECVKVLKRLGLHSKGLSFYSLRRTFRTIASDSRDEAAADAIMGHSPKADDMASVYRQRIDDDRLQAVVDHVRGWLFPRPIVG